VMDVGSLDLAGIMDVISDALSSILYLQLDGW
jgi:hypothetical protein